MSASPPEGGGLARIVGGAYAAGLALLGTAFYAIGDAGALVTVASARPRTLAIGSSAALLLLSAVGLWTVALTLCVLPAAPRLFRQRPRPPWARLLAAVAALGFATVGAGVLLGAPLQAAYLKALGYRLCGAARAGSSLYLVDQTWVASSSPCP